MNQAIVVRPLILIIGLIIALSGNSFIMSAINDWTLLTYNTGAVDDARVERVVAPASGDENADDAWYNDSLSEMPANDTAISAGEWAQVAQDGTGCQLQTTGTLASGTVTEVYAQNGTLLTLDADGDISNCEWRTASGIWTNGGFQFLIRLVFQACGLAPTIAILYAMYSFGSYFTTSIGVNPIIGVISLIIVFLLASRLLDTVVPYVSDAADAASSDRFLMMQTGLGLMGNIIGNFYAVVVGAGLLRLGWEVFKLYQSGNMSMSGFGNMSGGRGMRGM